VRARRHLVGDEGAVLEQEELDAQHADVADRCGDATGRIDGGGARPASTSGAGTCVTARMPSRCRFCCTAGRRFRRPTAGDDHAELGRSGSMRLEHAGDAAERSQAAASSARSATRAWPLPS
jgi:hypothetical protein